MKYLNFKSAKMKKGTARETSFAEFISVLCTPCKSDIVQSAFFKLPKEEQDKIKSSAGAYILGESKDGCRGIGSISSRCAITWDNDRPTSDFFGKLHDTAVLDGFHWFVHTTCKSTPNSPRYRVIFELSRAVTPEEHNAVSRLLAQNIGVINELDPCSHSTARLMFYPVVCEDGVFDVREEGDTAINVDEFLAQYKDWHDPSTLPVSGDEKTRINTERKTRSDPRNYKGVRGAFNRVTGGISAAIDTFLVPDVYIEGSIEGRYSYAAADSINGLVIYDAQLAYDNHASSPAHGKVCDSFDIVCFHLFGDPNDRAAYDKMCEWALEQNGVKEELIKSREESFTEAFEADEGDYAMPPFIQVDKKGNIIVNPTALAQYFRNTEQYFITHGSSGVQQFWRYNGGVYSKLSEDDIKGILDDYVRKANSSAVASKYSNEALKQLKGDGVGFGKYVDIADLNANEDIIVFENGVLQLSTGELKSHSSANLATIKLPLNWNTNALKAPFFELYLNDLTQGDDEKKLLIKEFIGLTLSNIYGYRTKKAMFLVGPGDSGKSQIRELLIRLVGHKNNADSDLSKLDERFMTGTIYGKRLIGHGDCSFAETKELKVFKMLTGGDSLFIENKYSDAFSGKFTGTMLFGMNRLPDFGGDLGRHVFDRIIILSCPFVIPEEKRDPEICDKMYSEREAVVCECIKALHGLIKRGFKFTEPKAVIIAREEYAIEQSTVRQFIKDRNVTMLPTDTPKNKYKAATEVYGDYCTLCAEYGQNAVKRKKFTTELSEVFGVEKSNIYTIAKVEKKAVWAYAIDYPQEIDSAFDADNIDFLN